MTFSTHSPPPAWWSDTQKPVSPEGEEAAVRRVGPHSVISHDSALALYNLFDALPDAIHVTVPRLDF